MTNNNSEALGASALYNRAEITNEDVRGMMGRWLVPTSHVTPDPATGVRERTELNENFLRSIREGGILQPLLVRVNPEWSDVEAERCMRRGDTPFLVVDGRHRLKAARDLELKVVPVVSLGMVSDDEALLNALLANLHRKPLEDKEIYEQVARLLREGVPPEQFQHYLGISPKQMRRWLTSFQQTFERGTPKVVGAMMSGSVSVPTARAVAGFKESDQDKVLGEVEGKPQKEAAKLLRDKREERGTSSPQTEEDEVDPSYSFKWPPTAAAVTEMKKRAEALHRKIVLERRHRPKERELRIISTVYYFLVQGFCSIDEITRWGKK